MRTTTTVVATFAVLCLAALAPLAADVIHSFPCDKSPGVGGEGFTLTGNWQYGAPGGLGGLVCPTALPGDCESWDPASAHTGDYVYGYDNNGDGLYGDSMGVTPLTTPALDCTGYVSVTLRFWRWLGVESPTYDHASIEVSNNGTDWTLVWENADYVEDVAWTQVEYDISAVADGEPTVYVRWVMGPTDGSATWCGWNIDDVEILGDPITATEILAWIPYTDMSTGGEYDNTLAALDTYYTWYNLTDSVTEDAGVLATELVGKDVFLAMEQEGATSAQLATLGTAFSDVLRDFVAQGGTVVVLGEYDGVWEGFLDATGLMSCDAVAWYWSGEALPVVAPSHPLAFGLGSTVAAQNATNSYAVGPEATVVIEDPAGNAVVAARLLGRGAAIVIGYDYYAYDADAARVLANAVQYPRATDDILLYQHGNAQALAQQALDDLGLGYATTDASDFSAWLTGKSWGLVVVDAPSTKPGGGFAGLADFFAAGGRGAVSTYSLTASEPALCAAFGVSADETFTTPQPIYRWEPAHAAFTSPMDVPDLVTFNDTWASDADRLSYVSGDVVPLAGYTGTSTPGQAAIVIADGIRILNAFLWDEANQDDDADTVDDVLELIINEIEFLRPGPRADFSADDTVSAPAQVLTFTDLSTGTPVAWYWDFGDGEYSVEQNPTHAYAGAGTYTVTLTASNADGQDTVAKTDYITVGTPGGAAFSATPTAGTMGMTVDFTDESAAGVTAWDWDFGDGGSATEQDPSHVYADPGLYDVSLTVTDPYGSDSETKIRYIWVGFSDCGPENWAFEDVLLCVDAGIVQGYPGGLYQPTWAVTRGQMAVFVARGLAGGEAGVPEPTVDPGFIDVDDTHWAYKYICYAVDQNVVTGFPEGDYKPDQEVTRDQMAVYMARAMVAPATSVLDTYVPAAPRDFPDVPTDHWAYIYVEYCVEQGIVGGFPEGDYRPDMVVTRDQMGVYVSRAFELATP